MSNNTEQETVMQEQEEKFVATNTINQEQQPIHLVTGGENSLKIIHTPGKQVQIENLLFSAENPSGLYLEDLLEQIMGEIVVKHKKLDALDQLHPAVINYRGTNSAIHQLLGQCVQLQKQAIEYGKAAPVTMDKDEFVEFQGHMVSVAWRDEFLASNPPKVEEEPAVEVDIKDVDPQEFEDAEVSELDK